MVEIDIVYDGKLRCSATHGPSGTRMSTDAPRDNMGLGESFSPTDLVGTALGTCMMTIIGITAQKASLDVKGATVKVVKTMALAPVRRIGQLSVEIHLPGLFTSEQRESFVSAAHSCPVSKSLHPDVQVPVTFRWDEAR